MKYLLNINTILTKKLYNNKGLDEPWKHKKEKGLGK